MALTPSKMIPLGSRAPEFRLLDTLTDQWVDLSDSRSDKATVIMFLCNHCPYVKHIREELVRISNEYIKRGVSFVAISSNDIEQYPEDSPQKMKEEAQTWKYPFPYLFDETQAVAKAYDAACTPDFYVYDKNLELAYRGQLDDSRPGNGKEITGKDIREALDCILSGNPVSEVQIPSAGCNIKWIV
jgi:peroxiredoxin